MEAAQACLSLHLSKCHIVGNHMSRLIIKYKEEFLVKFTNLLIKSLPHSALSEVQLEGQSLNPGKAAHLIVFLFLEKFSEEKNITQQQPINAQYCPAAGVARNFIMLKPTRKRDTYVSDLVILLFR